MLLGQSLFMYQQQRLPAPVFLPDMLKAGHLFSLHRVVVLARQKGESAIR